MPNLNDGLESFNLSTNNFGFSAERVDNLDATEYTLVTILVDTSSSTTSFRGDMRKAIGSIVAACAKSPRADNLMIRVAEFGSSFHEIHGFKKLNTIGKDDYDKQLTGGGMTALYDATENSVSATQAYAKNLTDNDFQVNAIVFIITDGEENSSKLTATSVKDSLVNAVRSESLESLLTILIGLNTNSTLNRVLTDFKDEVGLTEYVDIGDATSSKLAKLAEFVSKSISSQSQSLGTGGPSQVLTF